MYLGKDVSHLTGIVLTLGFSASASGFLVFELSLFVVSLLIWSSVLTGGDDDSQMTLLGLTLGLTMSFRFSMAILDRSCVEELPNSVIPNLEAVAPGAWTPLPPAPF